MTVLLLAVAVAGTALGALVAVKHRVAATADLAALAAAAQLPAACQVAAQVADDHRADVVECRTAGRAVEVVVQMNAVNPFGPPITVVARARAGPPQRDAAI